ncbi:hypothetical protein [Paenibacillus sp. 481]|uniref:hypothetical protein n=1 Tax=Paenibacillus sp. 481 TaxID=2835869 RepID=UPI001E3F5C8B|nr:hypothetical protein [Paenibacillus sp. 481]UHA73726.1 hypothetical protein KIK04_00685 [Paenibacillus sp. 481]
MSHLIEKLEQLYERESVVNERLETCIAYQSAILDYTIQEGFRCHQTAIEDILLAVHRVEMDLRTEVCHLKLAKALVSSEVRFAKGETV